MYTYVKMCAAIAATCTCACNPYAGHETTWFHVSPTNTSSNNKSPCAARISKVYGRFHVH